MLNSIIAKGNIDEMCRLASESPAGCFVEVGVYQGGSASYLYEIAEKQMRSLHLFDTFRGMPVFRQSLDKHQIGEFGDIDFRSIQLALPKAFFHVGIYPYTHPSDLRGISFIHCDCDQYDSYKAVIDLMWPLVVKGGILLFDDYPYLPGAKKAVDDFFLPTDLMMTVHGRYYAVKK